jgi:hypothetical protein
MTDNRKPFGIPGPPSRRYIDYYGALVSDSKHNDATHERWRLAMKTCALIAEDRRAERG